MTEWGGWELFNSPAIGVYIQVKHVPKRISEVSETRYIEGKVLAVEGNKITLDSEPMPDNYAALAWRPKRTKQFKYLEDLINDR